MRVTGSRADGRGIRNRIVVCHGLNPGDERRSTIGAARPSIAPGRPFMPPAWLLVGQWNPSASQVRLLSDPVHPVAHPTRHLSGPARPSIARGRLVRHPDRPLVAPDDLGRPTGDLVWSTGDLDQATGGLGRSMVDLGRSLGESDGLRGDLGGPTGGLGQLTADLGRPTGDMDRSTGDPDQGQVARARGNRKPEQPNPATRRNNWHPSLLKGPYNGSTPCVYCRAS